MLRSTPRKLFECETNNEEELLTGGTKSYTMKQYDLKQREQDLVMQLDDLQNSEKNRELHIGDRVFVVNLSAEGSAQ